MQLADLKRYGISERIIDAWRKRQGDTLLPVQRRAIRQGLLDTLSPDTKRPNMIIAAPTSAGKSFCAELAAARALAEQRRVVMVFPLRSLAEEKYRLFQQTYAPLGIRCLILTGDHPENDEPFLRGQYHIALAIVEKFDLALAGRLDLLRNIGLVVVDEIQTIAEPGRGAVLERLLTRIVASEYRPGIVGLSAVLVEQRIEPLADWLGAVIVEETVRPRELIRGVAANGTLTYRTYNDGRDGSEPFVGMSPHDDPDQIAQSLAERIKSDNGQTLIFLKSRTDTVNLALKLAASLGRPPARQALAQLTDDEPSFLLRSLSQALGHGVAFHNSDLSSRQRATVEQAFCSGEISVLCATTTLALGVNLPADYVYLETVKYASGAYDSRPELVPISRAEFDNMTGRAGRLGFGSEQPGRAVLMAESAFDSDVLWNAYIAPTASCPIQSAWSSLPTDDWVLHMIVCGLAHSEDDLSRVFSHTLYSRLGDTGGKSTGASPDFAAAIVRLIDQGFVERGDDGAPAATPVASAAVTAGLSVAVTEHLRRLLNDHNQPETPFGWLCLALSSREWALPPAILSSYEQSNNVPVRMLYRRFDHSVEEAVPLLPEDYRHRPLSYRAAATLKSALLLDQWRCLTPVQRLEERFHLHLGQIQYLGRTAAHLVSALGRLIATSDRESDRPRLLSELAFSLRFGLPPEYQEIHRRLGDALRRCDFLALRAAGIETLEDLGRQSEQRFVDLFGSDSKSKHISDIINNLKEEVDMQSATLDLRSPFCQQPRMIEIDGSYEADRYLVRIDGFPVRLTGKSFKYLAKLAWSRVNDSSGWIYKEDIEVGFNQARYLYRMKNEIAAGINSGWPVVENNRLGYYRLQIDPDKIRLNVDNLKSHPDYELRSLFESGNRPCAVN
ncbi:MAG: DEAD/DEAH box helicase [Candidatus Zixiibacteriota bacterium]